MKALIIGFQNNILPKQDDARMNAELSRINMNLL